MEIFAAAAPLYDFTSPALKPWHMKVSYQLYDNQGKPGVQGSYEYWWASPDTYRNTWSRPGMEQTDWQAAGKSYHAGKGESLGYFERKLQVYLLNALVKVKDIDLEKVRFDREEHTVGGLKFPCVMVIPKTPVQPGEMRTVPLGMFPTFCFDSTQPLLRVYFALGTGTVVYNKIVKVQGRYLPREISIYENNRRVLAATVDMIDAISATAPELTPSKDAITGNVVRKVEISSGVAAGLLLRDKEVRPVYPQDAKDARIDGKVVLQASIGTDGHVHDLSAVEGPSPSLIESAMLAVSQWEYKPYTLNGEPVAVETTINVIFNLGSSSFSRRVP